MRRLNMILLVVVLALSGCGTPSKMSSNPQETSDQEHFIPTPTPILTNNEQNDNSNQVGSNMVTLWIYAVDPFNDEPNGYFTIGSNEVREFDFSSNNNKHTIYFSAEQFEKMIDGDPILFHLSTGEVIRDFGKLDKSIPYIQEQIQPRKQWDLAVINNLQASIDDQNIKQSLETASEQLQISTSNDVWATPFSLNPAQSTIYFSADRAAIEALLSIPVANLTSEQQMTLTALIDRMTALSGLVVKYLIHQQKDRYEVLERDFIHWQASDNLLVRGDELFAVDPIKAIDYYEQAWDLALLTTQERFKNNDVQTDKIIYLSFINHMNINENINGYFRIGSFDMLYYSKNSIYLTPSEFKELNDGDKISYVDSNGKIIRFYDNFSKNSNSFSEDFYKIKYYHSEQFYTLSQAVTDDSLKPLLNQAYELSKIITSPEMWESTKSLNLSHIHEYFAAERELLTLLTSNSQSDRHELSFDIDTLLQDINNIDQAMIYNLIWHQEHALKTLDEYSASKIGAIPTKSISMNKNTYIDNLNNYEKMYELLIYYTQSPSSIPATTPTPFIPTTASIYGLPLDYFSNTEVVTLSIYMPRMLPVPPPINRMDCAYFLIGNTLVSSSSYIDHSYAIRIPKNQLDQLDGQRIIYRYHQCDTHHVDVDDYRAYSFGNFNKNTLEASLDIQHQRTIILEHIQSYIEITADPTAFAMLQEIEQRLQTTLDASFWETYSIVRSEKVHELLDHDRQIMQILSDLSNQQPDEIRRPLDGLRYALLLNDRYILQWIYDHPSGSVDARLWNQAGNTLVQGHTTAHLEENAWGPVLRDFDGDYVGAQDLYIKAYQLMLEASK